MDTDLAGSATLGQVAVRLLGTAFSRRKRLPYPAGEKSHRVTPKT